MPSPLHNLRSHSGRPWRDLLRLFIIIDRINLLLLFFPLFRLKYLLQTNQVSIKTVIVSLIVILLRLYLFYHEFDSPNFDNLSATNLELISFIVNCRVSRYYPELIAFYGVLVRGRFHHFGQQVLLDHDRLVALGRYSMRKRGDRVQTVSLAHEGDRHRFDFFVGADAFEQLALCDVVDFIFCAHEASYTGVKNSVKKTHSSK